MTYVHPYLVGKRLQAFAPYLLSLDQNSARSLLTAGGIDANSLYGLQGRLLVVPLYLPGWKLVSVQFIDELGNKRLLKGGRKQGAFWGTPALVQPDKYESPALIGIAEGVATALAVTALYGVPCLAGIDCGNLAQAGLSAARQWPQARFRFYADLDANGAGERGAQAAVETMPQWALANNPIAFPAFTYADKALWDQLQGYRNEKAKALSDFADYWVLHQHP